jgi:hypothetical protein
LIEQLKMRKINETEAAVPETVAEVEQKKDEDDKKYFDEIVLGRIDEVS